MSNGPAGALSPAQVYKLARDAGLGPTQAAVATAIAGAESGWDPDNVGDEGIQTSVWGPSVGLWQIRSVKAEYGKGTPRDASRLTDPKFNAASMASISGKGANFKPWSTYNPPRGGGAPAYQRYLGTVVHSVGTGGASGLPADTGQTYTGVLGSLGPVGQVAATGVGAAQSFAGLTSSWGSDAMLIGLKIMAVGTAAALLVVGAVHTVSVKG